MTCRLTHCLSLILCLGMSSSAYAVWNIMAWDPPFDYQGQERSLQYQPIEEASQAWHLCVTYPHLKDPYWLSVNYGMVEEAKRLGVNMTVLEAGGYPELPTQIEQLKHCAQAASDAIIVGAVSFNGLSPSIRKIAQTTPVIAAVNDIEDIGISAKSAVSWYSMGQKVGQYLAQLHPTKGTNEAKVAWFPGPKESGWVKFIDDGFNDAIAGSGVQIVAVKWGDTGKEIQRNLLQEVLEETHDFDYIVGTALTADAAVSELLSRNLRGQIDIVSTYFTHNVFRGIKRGHILAAPTDSPVLQGRLAVDQAVRILEGKLTEPHLSPRILMIDQHNVGQFNTENSLAPASFWPTFEVVSDSPSATK
ncbi:MAG: protein TorT [Oceanospirillaceae bacterium]|jgi:protein TorT